MKKPEQVQRPFEPKKPESLKDLLRSNKTLLCFTEHPTGTDIDWSNFDEMMEDYTNEHDNINNIIPKVNLPKSKLLKKSPSFQEVFDLAKGVIPTVTLDDIFIDFKELEMYHMVYYTYTCYYAFDRSVERVDRLTKQHKEEVKKYNEDLIKYKADLVLYNEYLDKYKEYEKEQKKEKLRKELEELEGKK